MAVPKIGLMKPEKSDVLKVADDLAAKSRILRRAHEEHEATLDRLRRIGDDFASEQSQRVKQAALKDVSEAKPLIDQAHTFIADAAEARKEAKPLLDALDSVNWPALMSKFSPEHGLTTHSEPSMQSDEDGVMVVTNYGARFSTDSTRHRIGRLQRVVEDLRPYVNDNSDSELRARLALAEAAVAETSDEVRVTEDDGRRSEWMQTWQSQYMYAVLGLRQGLAYGSVADAIRAKLAGVKKLISEIGEGVLVIGSDEETK